MKKANSWLASFGPQYKETFSFGFQSGKANVIHNNIVPPAQKLKPKQLFFLAGTKECPLSFNDRLVWSFLVYRLGQAKGDSTKGAVRLNQIEQGTGLDDRIIRTSLAELNQLGLAKWTEHDLKAVQRSGKSYDRCDGKVVAIQGESSQWFRRRKDAKSVNYPWHKTFVYFPISLPSKGTLTARQNVLYWAVKFCPRQKQTYYAATLSLSLRSAKQIIRDLRRLGLIASEEMLALSPDADLWVARAIRPKKTKKWQLSKCFQFTDEVSYEFWKSAADLNNALDHRADQMTHAGYSTKDVYDIWKWSIDLLSGWGDFEGFIRRFEHFLREFSAIFWSAESTTRINRKSGTFTGVNSSGLLKLSIIKAVEQIQVSPNLLLWSFCA